MRFALLSAVLFLAPGCSRICPREVTLTGLDGGATPCVRNTDCPRPSNVLVCTLPEDRLRDCIDCVQNTCVHFVPEACP